MSEYVIETGIPIPPKAHGNGAPPKYPFHLLNVGQSVVVPKKASGALSKRQKDGRQFTSRGLPDGLIRVWRIA